MEFDYDFEREERREKIGKFLFRFFFTLICMAAAVGLAWIITHYALEKTNMVGNSMEEALYDGDTIMINKLAYYRNGPERFDVIVFEVSGKEHSFYCIRRVVGLPGETVRISDGYVYINDELLEEPYVLEEMNIEGLAVDGIVLDEDEYFVLGDNRNNSEDSRFANVGNVVTNQIIGRAWLRLNRFGFVSSLNLKPEDNEE